MTNFVNLIGLRNTEGYDCGCFLVDLLGVIGVGRPGCITGTHTPASM